METISSIASLRNRLKAETSIAFVPTMGNLHQGHLQLMELARERASCVVSSIFVNRLQFGPKEDFAKYPRTFAEDQRALEKAGVDVLFAPDEAELYPVPQQVFVEPPEALVSSLCGEFRPGHFRGVATVVLKLFNAVQPQIAVFGKKDYQQLRIIQAMVEQLNLPVILVAGETQRAEDGLALSSRNRYLSAEQRVEAVRLSRILKQISNQLLSGERDFTRLESEATAEMQGHGWKVDYVAVREQAGLQLPDAATSAFVILAAAWLGNTRLIDNIEVWAGSQVIGAI